MKKFRCYEAKIEESEKASSRTQHTSGARAQPLSHDSQTASPHNPLYMLHWWYWMPQSHTWQLHRICALRTLLGVDCKVLSIRREPMVSVFSHSKCLKHLASHWRQRNYEVKIEKSEARRDLGSTPSNRRSFHFRQLGVKLVSAYFQKVANLPSNFSSGRTLFRSMEWTSLTWMRTPSRFRSRAQSWLGAFITWDGYLLSNVALLLVPSVFPDCCALATKVFQEQTVKLARQ